MSLVPRIATTTTKVLCLRPIAVGMTQRTMTLMSKQSAEEYKKLNYTNRMKETGRPVSPHVTIYQFPIGALSSITNRVTGVCLSLGAFGLGGIELLSSGSALQLMQYLGSGGFLFTTAAKFTVAFPVTYHYFAALRHFAWDNIPDKLTNPDVETSSYQLYGASILVSSSLALFV